MAKSSKWSIVVDVDLVVKVVNVVKSGQKWLEWLMLT